MKVVFMGTPEFAVPSLLELMKAHEVLAVVCQPDKPNKRGNKIVYGAVKQVAVNNGIAVLQPESVKDGEFLSGLQSLKPDIIVVVAYGKILPKEILKIPLFGCVNVHGSLLPKYRGAAPIQWAIINGEERTGITIMYMDEGLDTGDMIEKRHVTIEPMDTYGSLLKKMSLVGAEAIVNSLKELEEGRATVTIQNDAEATYAPIIKKETGHVNWGIPGRSIMNLVRGLNPSPGAYCDLEGRTLKIWGCEVFGKSDNRYDNGTIIALMEKKGIVVNAAEESVILTELQFSGGKKMSAPDLLRGNKIEIGMRMI